MAATLDARIRLDSSQYSGGLNRVLRETNSAVGKISTQFGSLRNVLAGGLVGNFAIGWAGDIMAAGIQAEKLQAAMSATAGDAGVGRRNLEQVRELAGQIGLDISAAAKSMIQFQSAGMTAAESLKTISAGYNAVISAGGGREEFSRFAVAIQQLRSSPKPLQEEINQLRDALPTTAKLMKETFGATRAEDIQKLNISGRELVDTMLLAMQRLPQVGDTLEKQIARTNAKLDEVKVKMAEAFRPVANTGLGAIGKILDTAKELRGWRDDQMARIFDPGSDPEAIRKEEAARVDLTEKLKEQERVKSDLFETDKKNADAQAKSIDQGKALAGVFGKFNNILRETKKAANEARDAMNFQDNMRAFVDADQTNALDENLAKIRGITTESAKARAEAQQAARVAGFDALQQAEDALAGPRRDAWQQKIQEAGMGRGDRKSERRAQRELDKNIRKAADKETRDEINKERKAARERAFDDLKNNKGFFNDEEGAKKRLRDQNRKEANDAVKSSAMTLGEIRDILKTLATA